MFDLAKLSALVASKARVARIVIANHKGSTPRETGAAMLVWDGGQSGTIGGGRLEFEAVARAHEMLAAGASTGVRRQPLGPALNQCCGGAVTLVTEVFDAEACDAIAAENDHPSVFARRVEGDAALCDAAIRLIDRHAEAETTVPVTLDHGWLIEPLWLPRQPVFIYGAGHVGRALALVLAPMPEFEVFLVDPREDLFEGLPTSISSISSPTPKDVMAAAPPNAAHYIMTPEHEYDLTLCHQILTQDFAFAGLIGSATKWARFRKRLQGLGHTAESIERIACPIGDPALGKTPQAIAIGVAAKLLGGNKAMELAREAAE